MRQLDYEMKHLKSVLLLARKGVKKSISASASGKRGLKDWWDNKPKPINLFPGEKEIFRQGPVLVTDTRISHVDPFDRVLKTYMFEHMISFNKDFYHASPRTRGICVAIIILTSLILLFTVVIDVMGEDTRRFAPVYIPLLISLVVGLIVWRDMRPKYRIEWTMRHGPPGGIKTEPLFREWLVNNNGREQFMNKLVDAMNQAIAGKAWWPHRQSMDYTASGAQSDSVRNIADENATADENPSIGTPANAKKELRLVTDNYR